LSRSIGSGGRRLADWKGETMVGLTFVVLAVVVFGVVVPALGLGLECLTRRSGAGAPPRP
jgi:hypothetical protein